MSKPRRKCRKDCQCICRDTGGFAFHPDSPHGRICPCKYQEEEELWAVFGWNSGVVLPALKTQQAAEELAQRMNSFTSQHVAVPLSQANRLSNAFIHGGMLYKQENRRLHAENQQLKQQQEETVTQDDGPWAVFAWNTGEVLRCQPPTKRRATRRASELDTEESPHTALPTVQAVRQRSAFVRGAQRNADELRAENQRLREQLANTQRALEAAKQALAPTLDIRIRDAIRRRLHLNSYPARELYDEVAAEVRCDPQRVVAVLWDMIEDGNTKYSAEARVS